MEAIDVSPLIEKNKELKVLTKELERIDKKILKIDIDVASKKTLEKLVTLKKERKEKSKEIKSLQLVVDELTKDLAFQYFEDITLKAAKGLYINYTSILSARADRGLSKRTTYYSGFCGDYQNSIIYYLTMAYAGIYLTSKKKYINKYIKVTDEYVEETEILLQIYESYFRMRQISQFISYAKRIICK